MDFSRPGLYSQSRCGQTLWACVTTIKWQIATLQTTQRAGKIGWHGSVSHHIWKLFWTHKLRSFFPFHGLLSWREGRPLSGWIDSHCGAHTLRARPCSACRLQPEGWEGTETRTEVQRVPPLLLRDWNLSNCWWMEKFLWHSSVYIFHLSV